MESKYQVSLFVCPGNLPFVFASHPWFVVNNQGKISRYELLFRKDDRGQHLRQDFLPPYTGIGIFPFVNKFLWGSQLIGSIEGDEGSAVQKLVECIENSKATYPHRERYSLTGPNSNTYAQWILNRFPEFKVKLPWNAFGKNYKHD